MTHLVAEIRLAIGFDKHCLPDSQKNLNGMRPAFGCGKFKPVARLQHRDNVPRGRAFGEPKPRRGRVHNSPRNRSAVTPGQLPRQCFDLCAFLNCPKGLRALAAPGTAL